MCRSQQRRYRVVSLNTIIQSTISPPAITASFFFVAVDDRSLSPMTAPTGWTSHTRQEDTVIRVLIAGFLIDIIPVSAFDSILLDSPLTPVISTDAVAGIDAN